jgi:transcriptional regulator GlxA family with amidase domain
VIWNGAEVLDWAGPSEVFAVAASEARNGDALAFNVYTVSKTTDLVVSQGFIDVKPDYSIATAPTPDIVVFPGGGAGAVTGDPEFLAWAGRTARDAEIALSVCTGAFILGQAGLLDGKDATTWYGAIDWLAGRFPQVRTQPGRRFVDNGQIVTTAGVSAGIDGSLHVVARLLGRYVADRTAEYMEYRWTPEAYLAKDYTVLNPSLDERGRRLQQAGIWARENNTAEAMRVCEALVAEDPADVVAWFQLGNICYTGRRYEDAVKAYARAAASPRLGPLAWYNAACSAGLLQDKERALSCLQKAFDAGYTDRERARQDGDLGLLHEDPRFDALTKPSGAKP